LIILNYSPLLKKRAFPNFIFTFNLLLLSDYIYIFAHYFFEMQIFEHIPPIIREIKKLKQNGKTIGFVPTMGAFHQGHMSLIYSSKKENDITVISIFVNPTQFNNKNDLVNYPRTLDDDSVKLKSCLSHKDIVFIPSEKEMYHKKDKKVFYFGNLDKVMEGKYRKGYFNGVALIVSKLFKIITPDKVYFGEKDFQQLVIIKRLIKNLQLPVQIIPRPIVREKDGLAMSSRNVLLSEEQRKNATVIFRTLTEAKKLSHNLSVEETKQWVINKINSTPLLQVQYFEIVDSIELQPINNWKEDKEKIGCVAVKAGKYRLIDNIRFDI